MKTFPPLPQHTTRSNWSRHYYNGAFIHESPTGGCCIEFFNKVHQKWIERAPYRSVEQAKEDIDGLYAERLILPVTETGTAPLTDSPGEPL